MRAVLFNLLSNYPMAARTNYRHCTNHRRSFRSTVMGVGGALTWPVTSACRRCAPLGVPGPSSGHGVRGLDRPGLTRPAGRGPVLEALLCGRRGWPAACGTEESPAESPTEESPDTSEGGELGAVCSGAAARDAGVTGARAEDTSTTELSPGSRCQRVASGSRYTSEPGAAAPGRLIGCLAVTRRAA